MKKLEGLNKEEILIDHYLEEYKIGNSFFFNELVTLNINIYIMDKIRKFHLGLFCVPDDCIFFSMVLNNFFEYSIVMISRIVADTKGDTFTLRKFKNNVRKYIKPEYEEAFYERMKKIKFDDSIEDILVRVRDLRNKRIAHTLEEFVHNTKDIGRINFDELELLRDKLNELYEALNFNIEHLMLPISYSDKVQHPKGADNRSDIEKILDSVAKESGYLTMPETFMKWAGAWERKREMMSQKEIDILNMYRKKFGMKEV